MRLAEMLDNRQSLWRNSPMSLEQWKEKVLKCQYVRKGEKVLFSDPDKDGVIRASIDLPHHPVQSIHIGSYFTKKYQEIEPGRGWVHE